jgi:tetratricopeptide (TPR) repeat protein
LVAQKGCLTRVDAKIFLAIVYRREKRPQLAIPLLEELIGQFPRNYLLYFELAQMYRDSGDTTKAVAALEKLRRLKQSGAPGYARVASAKIDYSQGDIQFWSGDLDRALENMQKATAGAKELELETRVLAWERLGQIYDLKGQRSLAQEAYRRAIETAPNSEAARESQRYLASPYRRRKG